MIPIYLLFALQDDLAVANDVQFPGNAHRGVPNVVESTATTFASTAEGEGRFSL